MFSETDGENKSTSSFGLTFENHKFKNSKVMSSNDKFSEMARDETTVILGEIEESSVSREQSMRFSTKNGSIHFKEI